MIELVVKASITTTLCLAQILVADSDSSEEVFVRGCGDDMYAVCLGL